MTDRSPKRVNLLEKRRKFSASRAFVFYFMLMLIEHSPETFLLFAYSLLGRKFKTVMNIFLFKEKTPAN